MQIGLLSGSIVGRREENLALFSFQGMDELGSVSDAGTQMLKGDAVILRLMFHQGDVFTLVCKLAEDAP